MACFALYVLLPRRRQPQELARRIHDRIVGRVFDVLDPLGDRQANAGRGEACKPTERHERQRQQRSRADPGALTRRGGDECLEEERQHIRPELIVTREGPDVGRLVERRIRRFQRGRLAREQARAQEILAGCIDDVEQG